MIFDVQSLSTLIIIIFYVGIIKTIIFLVQIHFTSKIIIFDIIEPKKQTYSFFTLKINIFDISYVENDYF